MLIVMYLVFEWRDLDSAVGAPVTGILFHPLIPVTGILFHPLIPVTGVRVQELFLRVQDLFLPFHVLFLSFHILASFVIPAS